MKSPAVKSIFWVALSIMVLHVVLIQPNHPDRATWNTLARFPLELPAIVLTLIALGQSRLSVLVRLTFVFALTAIAVLKTADLTMFMALSRKVNPVSDLPLIPAFFRLVEGSIGTIPATMVAIGTVIAIIGLIVALWWACGKLAKIDRTRITAMCAGGLALCTASLVAIDVLDRKGETLPFDLPGSATTARLGYDRVVTVRKTLADLQEFRVAAESDPLPARTGLFDLVDRDIFVIFVESYGRTSFDEPFYADTHLPTLTEGANRLEASGLSLSSTFLVSPTHGGQSWLSHATLSGGFWVDNQTSYRAALTSGRQTLFHLAQDAGFHTAAVMPQITLHWPESRTMGFDTILEAEDLGYKGLPFNWVTMPDQFTYAAMDRLLPRAANVRRFVQVATGSSHAPWVPVPEVLDWEALGDGTIFDPVVEAADTPAVVWRDRQRVRDQYRKAVDYALKAVLSYVERHADDAPLFLIIGDHQAASRIGLDERRHVPMHVIGPKALVDRIADNGFTPGLIPDTATIPRRMSEIRDHLVNSLTSAGPEDTM